MMKKFLIVTSLVLSMATAGSYAATVTESVALAPATQDHSTAEVKPAGKHKAQKHAKHHKHHKKHKAKKQENK